MSIVENIKSSISYFVFKATQKYSLISVLGMVAVLSWVAVFASTESGKLKVYFFDVGQGDAIFIELPDKRQILIDGGPNNRVLEKLNKVMPFWDREIDMMIATHADADHLTGLVPTFSHYDFETIIWNGVEAKTRIFQEWKEAANAEGAEMFVGKCCMRFGLSDAAFFEILYPLSSTNNEFFANERMGGAANNEFVTNSPGNSQNNQSLVIRFIYGNVSFLFTGDIERQAEYEIVAQNFNLQSDVLKVPHHGSKTSSSELFLERVSPKMAVISVGKSNSYGHPYEAILQRLEKYGINIRRTDEEGDIMYETN